MLDLRLESTNMEYDVTIIDYGVGNLLSVRRGFEFVGATVKVTDDPELLLSAQRVVLPGVGAFGKAMEALQNKELIPAIKNVIYKRVPFLGICLGMQLLFEASEEFGVNKGLSILPGMVKPLPKTSADGSQLKVPHIGWNQIQPTGSHELWAGTCLNDIQINESFYFVHSYSAVTQIDSHVLAHCNYGGHKLVAAVSSENITGFQFHPEKSGLAGLKILRRFCNLS